MRIIRPLAETGNVGAQYNLGVMYGNGQGVLQDSVEAHKWYNLAASPKTEKEDQNLIEKGAGSLNLAVEDKRFIGDGSGN